MYYHSDQDIWDNVLHEKTIWNIQSGFIIEKKLWKKCVLARPELMVARTAVAHGDSRSSMLYIPFSSVFSVCLRFGFAIIHALHSKEKKAKSSFFVLFPSRALLTQLDYWSNLCPPPHYHSFFFLGRKLWSRSVTGIKVWVTGPIVWFCCK